MAAGAKSSNSTRVTAGESLMSSLSPRGRKAHPLPAPGATRVALSGLVLDLRLALRHVRHTPHGDFAPVGLGELRVRLLDLARQAVTREGRIRDEPRRLRVPDEIHGLYAVLGPLRLHRLQFAIQRVVRVAPGDQHEGVEIDPPMGAILIARRHARSPVAALRALAV